MNTNWPVQCPAPSPSAPVAASSPAPSAAPGTKLPSEAKKGAAQ